MARKMSFEVLTIGDLKKAIEDLDDSVIVFLSDGESVNHAVSFNEDNLSIDSDEDNNEDVFILSSKLDYKEDQES
jgi:SpoU rRNA methylase family enzyme